MSLPAILWAMYEAPGRTNPTEKCVLMVLAEHADPSGACAFPSWERIAKTVGVSTRTIGSTLSSLQTKGLIRKGDQRIAEAAVIRRGKSRAYAPTVWDLVMDGSHAAATQAHLPAVVDEDREAALARSAEREKPQVANPADSAGLATQASGHLKAAENTAGQEICRSCGSADGCSETCSLASPRPEVSRRSGVKPTSDEPSTSTKNMNPPPRRDSIADRSSGIPNSDLAIGDAAGTETAKRAGVLGQDDRWVEAVLAALPPWLGRQAVGATLKRKCAELAAAGWSVDQLAEEVRGRRWEGAGVGAVIVWLGHLRLASPPQERARRQRTPTKAESGPTPADQYRLARAAAAPADSPARRNAIAIATAASMRARARRLTTMPRRDEASAVRGAQR